MRKQQLTILAERRRALAAWLNSKQPSPDGLALLISRYVMAMESARQLGVPPDTAVREVFSKGLMGTPLHHVSDPVVRRMLGAQILWSSIPLNMHARLRPQGNRIECDFLPQDQKSRHLYTWGELLNSGNADRLRQCPNCKKFWYCEGRIDSRVCSVACRVALWQKTPEGRAKKAEAMRRYRGTPGYKRKCKREKVGNQIRRSLGK